MASSAPIASGRVAAAHMHTYRDYNQPLAQPASINQQQSDSVVDYEVAAPAAAAASQQHQRMNLIGGSGGGGGEKPLVHHSNTSLANYDSYISGMSSDSELTTSGTAARHHHHRPYSSQSRVYHAHPVPRNTPAPSSRLSHYSSNSAANVHSISSSSPHSYQQHQQQQQHQLHQHQLLPHNQSLSTTPPAASAAIASTSHQSSLASSGGSMSSGSYLPAMMSQDSPISPVMGMRQPHQQTPMRQPTGGTGRQLPQRPFSQSMSIDQHHSSQMMGGNHYQPAMANHSPAHESPAGTGAPSLHRNLTGDQLGGYQQKSYPGINQRFEPLASLHSYNHNNETLSQRNMRLEMDRVEMRAAAMNLYDTTGGGGGDPTRSMADLPPTGPARSVSSSSSSSTSRHLPTIGASTSAHVGMHQHIIDSYNQNSQDPYTNQTQQHHRKIPDWLPPSAAGLGQNQANTNAAVMGGGRPPGGQFKQTMSIDHYPASRQQQQRHFTAAKQAAQFSSTEQYHSLGGGGGGGGGGHPSYVSNPTMGATNQLASIGGKSNYDAHVLANSSQTTSGLHHSSAIGSSGGAVHQQDQNLKYHHYSPSSSEHQSNYRASPSMGSHGKPMDETSGSHAAASGGLQQQQQPHHHHLPNRPKLQHQPSSSSSNSNLSGSLKSGHMEGASLNLENHQPTTSSGGGVMGEHQKSYPTASTSVAHYASHQSFQHKLPPTGSVGHHHAGRQDMLRRGHTSVTVTGGGSGGGGSDFGGSQSALSESGDLSTMQTSHSSHTGRRLRAASPSSAALEASSSARPHHSGYSQHQHHHHHHQQQQHHSTSSGHGLREGAGIRSESTTGLPNGSGGSSTLTKKSNSATQLSMTGTKKRLGFRKKQVTSFSVHRSEEVAPLEARHLVKQGSSVSEGDSSMSGDSSSRSWSNSKQTPEELASMSFIDGLGKGQMISRQGLASPYLGDIQLSLCDRRGNLEIEVIRARNLQAKTNKILPLTYAKLYLVKNRKCLAKAKTTLSNKRTLNPLFQQQLTFHEDYRGCILQSIVWGNFGKMDKKNFMGIAQISIDDLELGDTVISWYKLFLPSSLQTLPSKSLRHTLLSNSTESFTTTNNS